MLTKVWLVWSDLFFTPPPLLDTAALVFVACIIQTLVSRPTNKSKHSATSYASATLWYDFRNTVLSTPLSFFLAKGKYPQPEQLVLLFLSHAAFCALSVVSFQSKTGTGFPCKCYVMLSGREQELELDSKSPRGINNLVVKQMWKQSLER